MKEWHRTIILLALLTMLILFYVWLRTGYENRILESF